MNEQHSELLGSIVMKVNEMDLVLGGEPSKAL